MDKTFAPRLPTGVVANDLPATLPRRYLIYLIPKRRNEKSRMAMVKRAVYRDVRYMYEISRTNEISA